MRKALKQAQKDTAGDRIDELFEQASKRPSYGKRYVTMARKLSMRYKVRIPVKWRRRYCRECNAFFTGKNSRVRSREKSVVISCLECNGIKRIPKR